MIARFALGIVLVPFLFNVCVAADCISADGSATKPIKWPQYIKDLDRAHGAVIKSLMVVDPKAPSGEMSRKFDVGVGADRNRTDQDRVKAEKDRQVDKRIAEHTKEAVKHAESGRTMDALREYQKALDAAAEKAAGR